MRKDEQGAFLPLDAEARERALDLLGIDPLFRKVGTALDPTNRAASPVETGAHQADVLADEIAALEQHVSESLTKLDAWERNAVMCGREPVLDPVYRALWRKEEKYHRWVQWAYDELRRMQNGSSPAARPAGVPAPPKPVPPAPTASTEARQQPTKATEPPIQPEPPAPPTEVLRRHTEPVATLKAEPGVVPKAVSKTVSFPVPPKHETAGTEHPPRRLTGKERRALRRAQKREQNGDP
jgi:hypothetical protein